jgi:hypothetical protein
MKLYVWHDSCCDYTCGVMFALADSVEDARRYLMDEGNPDLESLKDEPRVYAGPMACVVWGGG